MHRIISDSCFQLKSRFNVDARAPTIPLLNFPFNLRTGALCILPGLQMKHRTIGRCINLLAQTGFKRTCNYILCLVKCIYCLLSRERLTSANNVILEAILASDHVIHV